MMGLLSTYIVGTSHFFSVQVFRLFCCFCCHSICCFCFLSHATIRNIPSVLAVIAGLMTIERQQGVITFITGDKSNRQSSRKRRFYLTSLFFPQKLVSKGRQPPFSRVHRCFIIILGGKWIERTQQQKLCSETFSDSITIKAPRHTIFECVYTYTFCCCCCCYGVCVSAWWSAHKSNKSVRHSRDERVLPACTCPRSRRRKIKTADRHVWSSSGKEKKPAATFACAKSKIK